MSAPARLVSVDRVVLSETPAGDARAGAEIVGSEVRTLLAEMGVGPVDAAAAAATVAVEVASAVEAAR